MAVLSMLKWEKLKANHTFSHTMKGHRMLDITDVPQRYVVGLRGTATQAEIQQTLEHAYSKTAQALGQAQTPPGTCCCYYFSPGPNFDLFAGFEFDADRLDQVQAAANEHGLAIHHFPPSSAVTTTHSESYDSLAQAWVDFSEAVQKLPDARSEGAAEMMTWEEYISSPTPENPEAPFITKLYWSLG